MAVIYVTQKTQILVGFSTLWTSNGEVPTITASTSRRSVPDLWHFALEVSSFYEDLSSSISEVAKAVRRGGHVIYIVGNRRVKDVQLSTDQFIAEEFEKAGFSHVVTYERLISSKSMPAVNSPSNKAGLTRGTMTQEFVVVAQRSENR